MRSLLRLNSAAFAASGWRANHALTAGPGTGLTLRFAAGVDISTRRFAVRSSTLRTFDSIRVALARVRWSAGARDELVKIKGQVVYSRENGIGMYETGISFEGTEEENVTFAKKLVKVFHHRKNACLVAVNQ